MSTDVPPSRTALPIEVIKSPFVRFAKMEAAGGILLLASTFAALVWANSPWEHTYHAMWTTQVDVGFGRFVLSETRHQWINDGLMAVFFFLVGLEIKREVLIGELSSLKAGRFPVDRSGGRDDRSGPHVRRLNHGTLAVKGWGIPMATDIAFALGVLALLGDRVPVSLKIFVTALAIVDDIIAVLVIALFYTAEIHFLSLAAGLAGVALSFGLNLLGVRKPASLRVSGDLRLGAVLKSGVHATVAGVLFAFTIPARTYIDRSHFLKQGRWLLDRFEAARPDSFEEHAAIHTLETQCELIQSPLHRIEHGLQPWVSLFCDAGVRLLKRRSTHSRKCCGGSKEFSQPGRGTRTFRGKAFGISLFAWLAAKARLATQPSAVSWGQIFGGSWLCGIGFTMSLFIATLAFGEGSLLDLSKIGTLAASVAAATCGSLFLLGKFGYVPRPLPEDGAQVAPVGLEH